MDFTLSLTIGNFLVMVILLCGVAVFARRVHALGDSVSATTLRSLWSFAFGATFLSFVGISGQFFTPLTMPFVTWSFLGFFMSAASLIVLDVKKLKTMTIIGGTLAGAGTAEKFLVAEVPTMSVVTMVAVSLFVSTTLIISLYMIRQSPNPFTVSLLAVVVLVLIAAVGGIMFIESSPQFYALQALPMIVAAAFLFSMLRPWRHIISLTVVFFAMVMGLSLAGGAYVDGDVSIAVFALCAAFAGGSTAMPLDFFIGQAVTSRNTTPVYISITLFLVPLLAITHSNNYAIAYSSIGVWDPNILFIDWFFGLFGVCAFLMAGISSIISQGARSILRDALIGLGSILLTLGHPYVADGRWDLKNLYVVLAVLLVIAIGGFFVIIYRLAKSGAGGAGARFLAFMFASLGVGIVAMFADLIPLDILAPLLIGAGFMLLASTPRTSLHRTRKKKIKR
ncbi:MAG: hypothetical protein ACP6KW_12935 [Candidatus Thorarchaeota archaeon]